MTATEMTTLVASFTTVQQRQATAVLVKHALEQIDNLYYREIFQAPWQQGSHAMLCQWIREWVSNADRTAASANKAALHAIALAMSSPAQSIPWQQGLAGLVAVMLALDAASPAWGLEMLLSTTYMHRPLAQVQTILAPVLS